MIIKFLGLKITLKNKKQRLLNTLRNSFKVDKQANTQRKLFNKYFRKYGVDEIISDLRLCDMLVSIGIKNEDVQKSAFIYEQLQKNIKSNAFQQYCRENKRIAIVGNCGRELGKKQGDFIDAHDVVIRFNNYPIDYKDDYGVKCNVWVRGFGLENEIKDKNIGELVFVVFGSNLFGKVPKHIINWLYVNLKKYPKKIFFISSRDYLEKYQLKRPTNGFIALMYLYEFIEKTKIDIYGYSFLDEEENADNSHYYDKLCNIINHSIVEERKILRKIFMRVGEIE